MPKRRYPEQRSATASPQPGQGPAQPTGDEVFRAQARNQTGEGPAEEMTPEEMAELEELRTAAAEAYERLEETADLISDRALEVYDTGRAFIRDNPTGAVVGAFAAGIILGIISSRR